MALRSRGLAASLLMAAMLPVSTVPASAGAVRDRKVELLSDHLFPMLGEVGSDARAVAALKARYDVATLLEARRAREAACGEDALCAAKALVWSDAEKATLGTAAAGLVATRKSDDGNLAGLDREIDGINTVIRTYALGLAPRYPQIDGSGIAPDSDEAKNRTMAALTLARTPRAGSAQGLDTSVEFALALLDANDRTDAIGYEPITGGLNAPAMARAKTIDWKRYRYSAMIVTGVGPEVPEMALSPLSKLHVRLAANRFAAGDIPFIIVTGGRAHPRATRFAEAEELRRALIERYGIPADAIVIEPYARHTTTNLRNATRRLMAMGAPLDRDTLIVCNPGQSAYIETPLFAQRNLDELGYQPGQIGRRLSPTELEFRPSAKSARLDPRDPLDP
ncbi:YdcF family protein [Novosphingobium sp. BL-8H]|uniref:YdcF family protein n=1 Tax=Novosphingobium sp. BL-8H TaxID=3127640 RepID=UPI0037565D5F